VALDNDSNSCAKMITTEYNVPNTQSEVGRKEALS